MVKYLHNYICWKGKGIKYSNIEKKIHKHLICDVVGVKSEVRQKRQNKWLKNVWLSKM